MKKKLTVTSVQTTTIQVESQVEIEVCQRLGDWGFDYTTQRQTPKYHAQIKGVSGYWASGDTIDEAVGNLIRTHPEKFGVKLAFLGKLYR